MVAVRRAFVRLAIAFAVYGAMCAGCLGRNHIQHDGNYQFTAQEITRDDCGLLRGSTSLWSGVLLITGDLLQMRMDERLYGMEAAGFFLAGVERFTIDGSAASVTAQVNGTECRVSLVQAHMDATTDTARSFHGASQVQFRTDQMGCSCQLSARFTAGLQ